MPTTHLASTTIPIDGRLRLGGALIVLGEAALAVGLKRFVGRTTRFGRPLAPVQLPGQLFRSIYAHPDPRTRVSAYTAPV